MIASVLFPAELFARRENKKITMTVTVTVTVPPAQAEAAV
jgi:hypothetical protein